MIENKYIRKNKIDKYLSKKYIYNKNIMEDYTFDETDTLMVKAGMGMGKTKKLHNLFKEFKNKNIVIVSFRITLDKEYINNFEGFELYSDIKMPTYDLDLHNNLVVQIDSFHKIRGNIDLLVLDEFSYTATHFIENSKLREAIYNTLNEYIYNKNTKIIIMDALLDYYMVKWFSKQNRKIYYIENLYKKHKDKKIINYKSKIGIFIESIINNLKENKKIILSTNSKNFLNTLELKIKSNIPNIKLKFLTSDNSDDINLDKWDNYDIVGYTPTIVAGVSFEKNHFDKSFGYFVNSSSPAEMSLQQLFRVRNINDNELHLCIENKTSIVYPRTLDELEKNIVDRNKCLVDGVLGIKISRINKTIIKDDYYYLYRNCQMKLFNSKNNYENSLINLLKIQGIINIEEINEINEDIDKIARKEMRDNSKNVKDNLIKDIITAEEIDDEQYDILKRNTTLTYKEKVMLKKKLFRINYDYGKEITSEIYKKYSPKYNQFKNINVLYNFKDTLYDYLQKEIQLNENKKIDKIDKYENSEINEYGIKLASPNSYILHQSKKNEKILIGLEMLNILGANSIFDKNKLDINFEKLYKYIKNREYIIRLLFRCKSLDIDNISKDDKGMNELVKYINSRLRTLFNIFIKKNKKINKYEIVNLDFWNEDINPLKENESLKLESYINALLNNMELDL